MSNEYRHRIYDAILVTPDGKLGIGTGQIASGTGAASLTVGGVAAVTEVIAASLTQTPQPFQPS